jgi:hypothetical protein
MRGMQPAVISSPEAENVVGFTMAQKNAGMGWPKLVMLGAGGVSSLLGLTALFGWGTANEILVHVRPALAIR